MNGILFIVSTRLAKRLYGEYSLVIPLLGRKLNKAVNRAITMSKTCRMHLLWAVQDDALLESAYRNMD